MKSVSTILEVFVAFFAIFSIIIIVLNLLSLQTKETQTIKTKILVLRTAEILLQTKNLRFDIINNNITNIENKFFEILPEFNLKFAIFDENGNNLTEVPTLTSSNVISISILISGYYENFLIREFRIYVL